MMKLSQEERTALNTGKSKFKTLLLIVLFSEIISPQIPFKGFCKLNSFKVDSGFTKIFSFNYDLNEHSDLLIYNPTEKRSSVYEGKSRSKFILNSKFSFPLEISSIEPIIPSHNLVEYFAFTSRKKKCFGVCKFDISGKPIIVLQTKFSSYPENISTVINVIDSTQDFLLSGNSFDGLSILSLKNNHIKEKRMLEKRVFKNAHFIDIKSDGFEDIAALNSFENKLHLFFNNSRGGFNELRTLNIDEDVLSMNVFDIDYDQYKDIIIGTKAYIKIYFGDATASFNKTIIIKTFYPADKFILADFNHDGFFDINYLNIDEGIISTIFARNFELYYPEFVQKKKKGIVDIIPFFSKFVYGAAYLNELGEVNILSSVSSMSQDQQLAIGIEPNLITSFDHLNDGIADFAFTDEYDKKIKFVICSNSGLPDKLYSVNLYEDHDRILEYSNSATHKTFYLYSIDKKIIESLKIDFEKFSFNREFHYAAGPIQDLITKPDNKGDAELTVLYSKNKTLNLQVITKAQTNYSQKLYTNLSSNWFDPLLFFDDKITVGYWQFESNDLNLNFINFTDKFRKPVNKLKISLKSSLLFSKSNQSAQKKDYKYSALLSAGDEIIIVTGGNDIKMFNTKNTKNGFRITDKNQLFFGKLNTMFIYNSELKSLTEFIPAKTDNHLTISEKFNNLELSNYTIQKLDQRNYHLIFSDITSGNIEIRQLSR